MRISPFFLTLVCLFACAPQTNSTNNYDEDIAIIESMREQELAAVLAGDVDALLDLRTDDFVGMLPGMPAAEGKDALREVLNGMFEQMDSFGQQTTTTEIVVDGNMAYHRGSFEDKVVMKGSTNELTLQGKFLWILRRQEDGSWKYQIHISNYNSM